MSFPKKGAVVALVLTLIACLVWLGQAPKTWRVAGVAGQNITAIATNTENASLRTLVLDPGQNVRTEQFWQVGPATTNASSSVKFFSAVGRELSFLGWKIPLGRREFAIAVPLGKDIAGASQGFSYEAVWMKAPREE